MDSETSDTKEHVSAMDKIADSFLAEVEAKENASAEPTDSVKLNRSDSLSISVAKKQLKNSKRKAKRVKEPNKE